ncbi:uncharacterized protein LOC130771654 [Actinidia eriantha]|uniref:uncharacterized protein LOC130771654 n=1 Tax=Actinidia eriantha TaxID=165200 RepID=UPI002587217E|nr:uncharacterized protein LOC130771654 [Actinidia eriantha]
MDLSKLERSQSVISIDWEEALHRYENVIACGDEALQLRATVKLARLANHAPENILARGIPVLMKLLGSSISYSIISITIFCLKRITCQGEGKLAVIVGQSGAIPYLLKLLPNTDGHLQKVTLKCLRDIVMFGNGNRVIVAKNGGLEVVLNMLDASPDGPRRFLLEILSALALLREVRRHIISLGSLRFLVEAARCGSMASRTRAAQAIGLLGLVKRARRVLVDSGAVRVLIELLRDGDFSTKVVAGNAFGVISSHVSYIERVAQAGAIPLFVDLFEGPEPMGKEIAEDVLCILAVSEENTVTIIEHLVRILRGDNGQAKAAAANVLWYLSSYKRSVVIRNSSAIPVMVELLRDDNVDVRLKVSGAVSQFSYYEADRVALARAGAIPVLIDLLQDEESEEVRDNAAKALVGFSEDLSTAR